MNKDDFYHEMVEHYAFDHGNLRWFEMIWLYMTTWLSITDELMPRFKGLLTDCTNLVCFGNHFYQKRIPPKKDWAVMALISRVLVIVGLIFPTIVVGLCDKNLAQNHYVSVVPKHLHPGFWRPRCSMHCAAWGMIYQLTCWRDSDAAKWRGKVTRQSEEKVRFCALETSSQLVSGWNHISHVLLYISDWWFGTFFIFPYIGNSHPNWLIFFRWVETTNQWYMMGWLGYMIYDGWWTSSGIDIGI